jgi:hypothetical protein
MRHTRLLVAVVLLPAALSACAAMQNTLAQDLAWERWEKCKHFRGITLKEIKTDGQIWVWIADGGEQTAWRACDSAARVEQGKRGGSSIQPTVQMAFSPPPTSASSTAPIWRRGTEWAYRYEQPSGTGTFVWSVDRIETVEGQPHYVITSGTREIFYRVADLGLTRETVEGRVVRLVTPPDWRFVAFPLVPGKSWDMKYHEERPVARETEDVERTCLAEAEESITVPAGTFSAVRVSCKNSRTGAWLATYWYASQVGHIVREESSVAGGKRIRELISYRLR